MNLDLLNLFERNKLNDFAKNNERSYAQALPFSHVVIDNFLPSLVLEKVLDDLQYQKEINWKKYDNAAEKKLTYNNEDQMGASTRMVLYQLNSSIFICFLEALTGIYGLIPDPHFKGGGIHQIERGGYFKIHADSNRHPKLLLDRRLVLLLYLNKDWKDEYGGHLELWNRDMTECVKRILPIFNRCVIFNTTDFSYHGHPEPLKCPEGETRKSLALYYYTNGRPSEEISTEHATLFQTRPGEKQLRLFLTSKLLLKKIIPPIFIELKNYWQNGLIK